MAIRKTCNRANSQTLQENVQNTKLEYDHLNVNNKNYVKNGNVNP